MNPKVQTLIRHGIKFEPVAREKYLNAMRNEYHRNVTYRDCGFIIQPALPWLGGSPDGVIVDHAVSGCGPILLEIKCPQTKWELSPMELFKDESFYLGCQNGQPYLKKNHARGYYTQIQMCMGLAKAEFCDFIVYTKHGLVITRVQYDNTYFEHLISKLNYFFKTYILSYVASEQSS